MAFSSFGNLSYIELNMATEKDTFFLSKVFTDCAAKYSKSAAQIALRWAVQRNCVVIPKSSKEARLKENMEVFDFELTEDEMKEISALD